MEPFLNKLSAELLNKYGSDISSMQVVFPSRRAGIYFKKYLSERIREPLWSPVTCGVSDFIKENSDQLFADDLTLIFELYDVYKKLAEDVTFDKFYPWGEIILRDFDEIDKNLAEADYLFRILREHKKVEEDFELNVSDIDEFYRFWNSFSGKDISELQQEFIKTWEILGKVYHNFRSSLVSKNICYEGMAYRKLHEKVKTKKFETGYSKIVFAGFNQLNRCEGGIFKELVNQGLAETYWDGDKYYIDDKIQEAGKFLRKNFTDLGINVINWKDDNLGSTKKHIKIIGAPLEISQAKVLGNELRNLSKEEAANTAIVLPDDNMLIPILHSFPAEMGAFNITMGYSFKDTLLYTLFELLRDLVKNTKGKGDQSAYYHKDIISILLHPYIRESAKAGADAIINAINKRNIIYSSAKFIKGFFESTNEIINVIFKPCNTAMESLELVDELLAIVDSNISQNSSSNYEKEFINKAYTELNHIKDILTEHSVEIDNETLWNILIEHTSAMKVPFTGEPLKGVQLMGLLETRQLDFDNVFILSVNEGILPRDVSSSSFIPFALKKAFKLPVSEDTEADEAYYFYRLLQRAKNVTLIYNTETGVIASGEKSRFIMQVENELAQKNKNIKLEKFILQGDIELPKRWEITVDKSPEILEILKNEKQFSATTLSTYINCPLQFYFKKAAKLKELDSAEEYFTSGAFGDLFHQIMENLYSEFTGKEVTEGDVSKMLIRLNNNYDEIWKHACEANKEYIEFSKITQGKNLLYKGILQKLVKKVLEEDLKETPFKVLQIESESKLDLTIDLNGESISVPLYGRLDRVEIKNGTTRIIDYKTGTVKKSKQSSKSTDVEHIASIFNDIKLKENFQQLFYALLYLNENNTAKLQVGIYPLKEISGGVHWFENETITNDKKLLFEEKLKDMLSKIFDTYTPFTQTSDTDHCKYCPYISICYRD